MQDDKPSSRAKRTTNGSSVSIRGAASERKETENSSESRAHTRARDLESLLGELDEIRGLALAAERTYVNKHGEELTVPQPDFRAAVDATRLQSELLGLLRKGSQEADKDLTKAEQAVLRVVGGKQRA